MSRNHRIGTVETTFDIIEMLVEAEKATLSELANAVGMPQSTVYDHLMTLQDRGYVLKEGNSYRPSLRFLKLGGRVRFDKDLYHIARPELRKLTNETGEPATLAIEEGDYAIYTYSTEGEYTTRSSEFDGSHTWLHANAPGKVFLAHSSKDRVECLIDQYGLPASTEHTITDPTALYEELETILEQGYALDSEEGKLGMRGVAKPIFSPDREVLAAVCVYGATRRMNTEDFVEQMLKPLERVVDVIEINLSYET